MTRNGSVRDGPYDRARSVGTDRDRHQDLIHYLSSEERLALGELGHDQSRGGIPAPQALRLLCLGLAELACGRLVLTKTGRHALAALLQLPVAPDPSADGQLG